MTRILRLLLIAAVALPLWQPAAAQDAVPEAKSNVSVAEMKVSHADICNVGLSKNGHKASVVKTQVANEPEGKHVDNEKINTPQQVADFSVPVAAMKGQKASGKKSTKGVSLKADKVTVTPPANAEVEYWSISSTYYYYNNGWQNTSYNNSVKVAIDGNDIYIAGLCVYIEDAWVKGTINGSTVTFPSPQYYGSITQDGETYDFWFVGENSNGNEQNNVSFSYNATIGKLTMTTDHIATKTADTDGSWYGWHESVVITRPLPPDPEFTICNGTVKNEYVPVYGFYFDTQKCESQMIYPAATIKGTGLAAGDQITAITFYVHSDQSNGVVPNQIGTASVEVRIGETTATTIGSYNTMTSNRSGKQTVFSGNLPTGDYKMTITFSQPYTYNGGNLLIDTYVNTKASYAHCYWTGVSATSGSSCYGYPASGWPSSNTFQAQAFLPKMSIEYTTAPIESGLDVAINGADFFEGKTYTWTDSEGSHESTLADVATKPEQMIAMIQKVYTDPTIPGNLKRGFSSKGRNEPYNDVAYTGVGTIVHDGSSDFNSASHYSWADGYGWGISGNTGNTTHTQYGYDETFMAHYSYMDSTKYLPNENGLTLLLVEIKDDYTLNSYLNKIYNTTYDTPYDMLKAQFAESVKSIRVVKEAKRTGEGVNSGTLFKIDCDKMNKFFLIAKGQMRYLFNSQRVFANFSDPNNTTYYPYATFCRLPLYAKSDYSGLYYDGNEANTSGGFIDENTGELFYHMFEQFSPYDLATQGDNDDLYQDLINMRSFGVKHDCVTVPMASPSGHHFMMYGEDSPSADCQDVRDLMFFIPDYRMMYHSSRDANAKFLNYNPQHMPTMGLYVIRQDEITPTTEAEDYYMLQLNWRTNLDDFLPSQDQEFELLQIVVDDNGNESYVPVYYMNANGQYTDAQGNVVSEENKVPIILVMEAGRIKNYPNVYVQRQQTSQQVTYAIRGRDAANAQGQHFLSLQISNRQSYIIPGQDPSELVLLEDATHYSRFDAQRVRNCYSNKLMMSNNLDGLKQANLTSSTQLTITRQAQGAIEPTTIATVTFNPSSKQYTVQMSNQAQDATEFPECVDGSRAGYHANNGNVTGNGSWTGTYTVNANGDINLGTLEIFDNFVQDIPDDNTHPNSYMYNVSSNYECPATSVYLNAANCTSGDEIWYAWTWNNQNDGKWVMGTMQGNLLKFAPAKNNIIFVRMDPNSSSVVPSWGAAWNQTGDLSTVGYIGKTFTVNWGDNGSMYGSWSDTSTPDMAHSNAFRIPIYKTSSQINGSFDIDEVDGDTGGALGLPENIEFGVGVQLSSKSEILRYDTYRWGENEDRYLIAWADGDDEQDLPPTGLAMNQGEYYTISMNPDTDNETNGEASVASGSGTATFVDEVPGASTNAAAFTYAPVVEAFSGRGDYNTYGGPLQGAAVGKVNVEVPGYEISTYSWKKGDDRYAYYNVELRMTQDETPIGYEIYRVRAWREMDTNLLDEPLEQFSGRKVAKYLFEDMKGAQEEGGEYQQGRNMVLGAQPITILDDQGNIVPVVDNSGNTIQVYRGTFGARKVTTNSLHGQDQNDGCVESLDMNFKVRIYFTKANSSKADGEDSKQYYIVEKEYPFTINGGIPTGIVDVMNAKQIVSEKYYNVAGIESDTPFQGVNIVVTRYSDGSTTTTKILK